MRAAAPPQQAASERRCYKFLECVSVLAPERSSWQEALLIDQFSSICCFPPSFKRPFSSSFVFSRVSRVHRAAGGSLRSSLDRSWRCEAPFLLLGSFGPFSSLSFEAPSFAARLGAAAPRRRLLQAALNGGATKCGRLSPWIYEERTFLKKRLGCFLFSLLARPFSRPSDLKSRSCSNEGFISAGAVCAASSYLAFSIIGGGFGRLFFVVVVVVFVVAFDLGARGALFGRRVLGLRGVACAPPS